MNSRDYGIWLIPILAALAIYLPRSTETKTQSVVTSQGSVETKTETGKAENNQLAESHPLLRFFGVDKFELALKDLGNYEIGFLIATVPDPIESSLGYLFDRHVSAIQLAGQAAQYVPDSFNLPWLEKGDKVVQQGKAIERYKLDQMRVPRIAEETKTPRHQREPGVMLLRARDKKKLLLLYLIGETPTTGIQTAALKSTLREIKSICKRLTEAQNATLAEPYGSWLPRFPAPPIRSSWR
jgi:hypothetical protein